MSAPLLLLLITVCYAGYNLLIRMSGSHSGHAVSPLLATISLQMAALGISFCYLLYLWKQNVELALPAKAYPWAIAAGVCIGLAEIMYFYLFRGAEGIRPIAASVAIPLIVGGTIAIVVCLSVVLFGERLSGVQWLGVLLTLSGLLVLGYASNPK